jgi:hypothetical protein
LKVEGVKPKKNEKKHALQFEKMYLACPLALHFKDDL